REPRARVVGAFKGLAAFDVADAQYFVGRERLTAELVGLVADHRAVVVVGASGTGKSSILRAGLIAALRRGALPGSAAWRTGVTTPAAERGAVGGEHDLLVLDQAEELFTVLTPGERQAVVERLEQYTAGGGRLVLALRGDFYGRLAELQPLAAHARAASVLVGPLRDDEVRRVVVEPAERVGLTVEPDLVETVLDDVAGQPAALPMLSTALVRTWENRAGDTLTLAGYRRGGGVASAVEATAEDAYLSLEPAARVAVRRLLLQLAGREGDGWVRRPLPLPDTSADPDTAAAVAHLAAARLVTVTGTRIELTHDALLVHWPRLRGWLDERVLAADLLDHLGATVRAWAEAGRPDSDLYRGARLRGALDWRDEHPDDVTPVEREFLAASEAAADAQLTAAREQARREARGRRRLRAVAIGLAAMVVLAAVGVVVALHERGSADRAAASARAAALAADSRRLAALSFTAPDIATSSLLAVAAYRLQDSADSRGALLAAVERNSSALWRFQAPHRLLRVAVTPDGTRLAVMDNRRQVTVLDPRTRRVTATLAARADYLEGITADGRMLVTFGSTPDEPLNGRLALVDVASGRRTRVLTEDGDPAIEPAFSSDAHWLVHVTGGRRTIDVFDAHDWSAPPLRLTAPAHTVAVAAGHDSMAVLAADGTVEVRGLPSLRVVARLRTFPEQQDGTTLGLAPDGSRVAVVDGRDPRRVAILQVTATGQAEPVALPTQLESADDVLFAPDGSELAVLTESGAVSVYRTADGSAAETLAGHAGPVVGGAWSGTTAPTGLYTAGLDSELVSWGVTSTPRLASRAGADLRAPDVAETFGHWVVGLTPHQGGALPESKEQLLRADLDTGRWTTFPLGLRDDEYVNQTMASRDGTRAVLSIQDPQGHNRVEVWDLVHGHRVGTLQLPADAPDRFVLGFNAAISPDGGTAYVNLGATRIGVFALPSGRYLRSFTVHFGGRDGARVLAVPWRFAPDGTLLFGGYDTGPHATGGDFALGPDDASPPDHRLAVVDPASGRVLAQTGMGDVGGESTSEWSPDGRLLAVGTLDGTLTLYDARTLHVVTAGGAVESGYLLAARFAPDGRSIVASGTAGTVDLFTVPGLQRLAQPISLGPSGNAGGLFAWYASDGDLVGFGPDPAHPDAPVQRWFDLHVQPAELARTACRLAGGDMTRAQWQRYVGDRPYRPVCSPAH
ncbi:MAG: NACHT and WD repeat domain-containing protein, partial [Jatrophihabitans sp.]|uniref:NACHT and WD repeat domain-containing protein n=1 Tax=Jatrophihabitans sp. TaxID=1932789 RepID=UPI003F7D948C